MNAGYTRKNEKLAKVKKDTNDKPVLEVKPLVLDSLLLIVCYPYRKTVWDIIGERNQATNYESGELRVEVDRDKYEDAFSYFAYAECFSLLSFSTYFIVNFFLSFFICVIRVYLITWDTK